MQEYFLTEETTTQFYQNELEQSTAVELFERYKDIIDIQFPTAVRSMYILRPGGYVGHISVSDNTIIHIGSKVPIDNIFSMLEYAYDLKSFKFEKGTIELKKIDELYETLASALAKMVLNRYRKGLYRDYVKREESLPYLKGRLLITETIKAANRGSVNLECEYCENTADIIDNKILAWTLYKLPRHNLKREDVRQQIRQAYRVISNSVDISTIKPQDCVNRLYHRLNEDYKSMHILCKFFLEQTGPLSTGKDSKFLPFILNMPRLYELFLAKWLEQHLPKDIQIKIQYNTYLDVNSEFKIIIDLLLVDAITGRVLAVLDTKYKDAKTPTNTDISQIVLYAVHMGTNKAFLVYPSEVTKNYTLPIKSIEVNCLKFDISKNLEESGQVFLKDLVTKLRN